MRKMLGASWKTSTIGYLGLVGALCMALVALLDGDPATKLDKEQLIVALGGVGLILAREEKVSSEKAGAK